MSASLRIALLLGAAAAGLAGATYVALATGGSNRGDVGLTSVGARGGRPTALVSQRPADAASVGSHQGWSDRPSRQDESHSSAAGNAHHASEHTAALPPHRADGSADAADTADVAASTQSTAVSLDPALPKVAPIAPPHAQLTLPGDGADGISTLLKLLEQVGGNAPQGGSPPGGNSPTDSGAGLPGPAPRGGGSSASPWLGAGGAAPSDAPGTPRARIESAPAAGEGDHRFRFDIRDTDIREVLKMLGEHGGLNIIPSRNVTGSVSAVLSDVSIPQALEVILRQSGYISRRDGPFLHVGTPQDFDDLDRSLDRIGTRVYRPNYVQASELEALLTPLLTPTTGRISVTSPAKTGIGMDSTTAGGNDYAMADALLVQDYEAVLAQIDQVVAEIDRRPLQVAIEAMILAVRLDDVHRFGVDWRLLRDKNTIRLGIGSPTEPLTNVNLAGGMTVAFLDSSLGAFLEALETIGETNVISTPRLTCLNKQRAEILIGAELGYVSTTVTETAATQTVEFLEVGTALRLRPYISSDGLIRMEIHPELSTGNVRVEQGFTLPDKEVTQVTTNVMVRDGSTIIIGGLLREDLTTVTTQIPFFGGLPVVGWMFRTRTQETERRELLVLVTPRIMYDQESAFEGDEGACEFHRRQAVVRDQMSPAGKRYLGRKYLRLAQDAWAIGDMQRALRYARWAVHFDGENRSAIELLNNLLSGQPDEGTPAVMPPLAGDWLTLEAVEGEEVAPWLLDALEGPPTSLPAPPLHPRDSGQPGPQRTIERPRNF